MSQYFSVEMMAEYFSLDAILHCAPSLKIILCSVALILVYVCVYRDLDSEDDLLK